MDNFTHSLAGWVIGQAGLKTKTRKGLAALILGANAPDIDVFFGWVPWEPLATHRGFTHSLVGGVIILPLMLAGLLLLLDQWQVRRGAVFRSGLTMRFGWLVALSYLGVLTHPLLDLQTSYSVQLLSPFDEGWFHEESLFIIDVWLWTGVSLAIWLSRRRERIGGDWRTPARAAIVASLLYIGGNIWLTRTAKNALVANAPFPNPDIIMAGHEPVKFWNRTLIFREGRKIGRASWSPFSGFKPSGPLVADNMDDPHVQAAFFVDPHATEFLRWSLLPMGEVEAEGCKIITVFRDARFGDSQVRDRFLRKVTLPGRMSNKSGCP